MIENTKAIDSKWQIREEQGQPVARDRSCKPRTKGKVHGERNTNNSTQRSVSRPTLGLWVMCESL